MATASKDISDQLKDLVIASSEIHTTAGDGGEFVGREIGRGAYGRVYTVKYRRKVCAAKEIRTSHVKGVGQQDEKNSYLRVCQQWMILNHPNIVHFMGIYYPKVDSTIPVMIMELMDKNLYDHVNCLPKNAWMIKNSILIDVAEGLSYLHRQKPAVVHCNLSPKNILLKVTKPDEIPAAKISDLGVAKTDASDFMPPESSDGPVYSVPKFDVFSYGGIMLFVVTHRWPTPIPVTQTKRSSRNKKPVTYSEVERRQKYLDEMTGDAEWLKPLIVSCLSNDPSERPTMSAVSERLQEGQNALQTPKDLVVSLESGQITSKSQVYYLKPYTKIGRPDAEVQQDIQLKGLGIQPEHCIVEVVDSKVLITPLSDARIMVNGKIITERTKLCHGCPILLGVNHFFQLNCPEQNDITDDPTLSSSGDDLQTQFYLIHKTGKEMNDSDHQCLKDALDKAKILIKQAKRKMNQTMKMDTVFKVIMQIPANLLTPIALHDRLQVRGSEISIRVVQRLQETDSVLSIEDFEKKIADMMHHTGDNTNSLQFRTKQPALLGVANIFMQSLFYCVCHEHDAPLIGPTGKECGRLKLSIEIIQVPNCARDELVQSIGSQTEVKIQIVKATGLSSDYCDSVFAQYKFWNQSEPTILTPLQAPTPVNSNKLLGVEMEFNHIQVFTVDVTKDFLDYLKYGALSVEIYGHCCATASVAIGDQSKEFSDRCYEVKKNLEMWVRILESNGKGNDVPVAVVEGKTFKTEGAWVFMLRKGQSRKIEVEITPVEGSGDSPLQCSHITSIAIGSFCDQKSMPLNLDSYQENDLGRLRDKWRKIFQYHIKCTQKELNKFIEKKDKTNEEKSIEQALMKQYTALQLDSQKLEYPNADDTKIPGALAKAQQKVSLGMEPRAITLFLDLNDDMLTPCDDKDPVAAISTAPLIHEDDHSMIKLPLLKCSETAPKATASWDSFFASSGTVMYAILRVSVMLKHPPGIELVLRKRLCLRINKKLLSSNSSFTQTGVTYEVVTGTPKLAGLHLSKFPTNHPSVTELEENDDVVEKYKENIMLVCKILTNDLSNQEVVLKKNLDAKRKLKVTDLTMKTETNFKELEERKDTIATTESSHRKLHAANSSPAQNRWLGIPQSQSSLRRSFNTSRQRRTVRRTASLPRQTDKQQRKIANKSPLIIQKVPHEPVESGSSESTNSSLLSSLPTDRGRKFYSNDPPCTLGEKVMVDTTGGFKFGKVKFIGSTEFAAGEWIGVALERQSGKHDGTVKGVKYFQCKEKHGLFVRRDKIIRNPVDMKPDATDDKKRLELQKDVFTTCWEYIVEHLNPDDVIDSLVTEHLIGDTIRQQLSLPGKTTREKNRDIIEELCRGRPGTYEEFCRILMKRRTTNHIADKLEKEFTKLLQSSQTVE